MNSRTERVSDSSWSRFATSRLLSCISIGSYFSPYWESIEQYAEVNDENRLVILSHYPIPFYKNQHYGAVMLYRHVHNTREWSLVEKWKNEQWTMGIPSRLINVGCMMAYMNYTPRTLDELLEANPQPMIERIRKDGIPAETDAGENSNGEL